MFLTIYLWVLILGSLLASAYLATQVSDFGFKTRLPVYLVIYDLVCILLRFVAPSPEVAVTLSWMNPLLGLTARIVFPVMARVSVADQAVFIMLRATATLVVSAGLCAALGFVLGGMLDDRVDAPK